MTHVGWIVLAAALGLVLAFLVGRRARTRRAIEELDRFALLTEARWEGDAVHCRIAGGAQFRVDVTMVTSIDWREYGDGTNGSDWVVVLGFAFAGAIPPVAIMGSGRALPGRADAPISTLLQGLKERGRLGAKPNHRCNALSPITIEAQRHVATLPRTVPSE